MDECILTVISQDDYYAYYNAGEVCLARDLLMSGAESCGDSLYGAGCEESVEFLFGNVIEFEDMAEGFGCQDDDGNSLLTTCGTPSPTLSTDELCDGVSFEQFSTCIDEKDLQSVFYGYFVFPPKCRASFNCRSQKLQKYTTHLKT